MTDSKCLTCGGCIAPSCQCGATCTCAYLSKTVHLAPLPQPPPADKARERS